MSTPAVDVVTVEEIVGDVTPMCQHKRHKTSPVPADWWVEFHGCGERFACTPCLDEAKQEWEKGFAYYIPTPRCRACKRHFAEMGEVFTREVRVR